MIAVLQPVPESILDPLRPSNIAAAIGDFLLATLGRVISPDTVSRALAAVHFQELTAGTINTLVMVVAFLLLIGGLEIATSGNRAPYRSRVFAQDLLYALFYHGGFYTVLIWAAIANIFEAQLGFLRVEALAALPTPIHVAIYWLFGDFVHYWVHRAEHKFDFLWAIHSVHHSQEEMTFISTFRMHPLEYLLNNLIMVVPLMVLGVPTESWLALNVVLLAFDAAQHSALDWTYGRAYPVIVSPRFHSLHHSIDPRQYNGNYSKILSVWDFLFGTAIRDERPARLGVEGMPVPRTIGQQLLAPFRHWLGVSERASPEPTDE